jgi:hypothetical protein
MLSGGPILPPTKGVRLGSSKTLGVTLRLPTGQQVRPERRTFGRALQQRTGSSRKAYCRQHRLDDGTFARWIKVLAGEEAARKLAKYQAE